MSEYSVPISFQSYGRRPRPYSAIFPASRKSLMEAQLVRRRDMEREKCEYWQNATKYFDKVERNADKFNLWISDKVMAESIKNYNKERNLETRKATLLERRTRLKELLEQDKARYEEELRNLPSKGKVKLPDLVELRIAKEKMKKQREEEQQKEAEEKMLQHWKLNNPDFRELQLNKRREIVQKAWDEQRKQKEIDKELQREQDLKLMQKQIEENVKQDIFAREEKARKEKMVSDWKATILRQIEELQRKKQEEKVWKDELRDELDVLAETERVEIMRNRIQKKRKEVDLGNYLKRQHALKLKIQSAQIQKELNEDARILEEMQRINRSKFHADQERKEKQRKELEWMRKVLSDQKAEEEKREKKMNLMFSEEAEQFWEKQEKIWQEEKLARERLMEDVVKGWRVQIDEKIQEANLETDRIAEERRRIQEEIETLNIQIEKEEKEAQNQREMLLQDLDQQVQDKLEAIQIDCGDKRLQEERNNELAEKLAKFDDEDDTQKYVLSDFRRRKAKWF